MVYLLLYTNQDTRHQISTALRKLENPLSNQADYLHQSFDIGHSTAQAINKDPTLPINKNNMVNNGNLASSVSPLNDTPTLVEKP
jgi:hypothetical protein